MHSFDIFETLFPLFAAFLCDLFPCLFFLFKKIIVAIFFMKRGFCMISGIEMSKQKLEHILMFRPGGTQFQFKI
eukprot:TRINITY_DN3075_c0_g2_i1.p2 TRINITY_DN3075_c0_g2~~TRINITY_DN3075_c0_g2_i1.p2  ORF type:complete len:74 (+),score=3.02 TRINITY_DN3075_c0_g2_i1:78-299(+)